jgi:hypothetical protein
LGRKPDISANSGNYTPDTGRGLPWSFSAGVDPKRTPTANVETIAADFHSAVGRPITAIS